MYSHIISLGFFCSTALEIERYGLRDYSYPFDWVITHGFSTIIGLIESNFEGFLDEEDLYQRETVKSTYRNIRKNITFVHDFDSFHSLDEQIDRVKEKYSRRIKRFYDSIKDPTLFIRYVDGIQELEYIEKNYNTIIELLRSYNTENRIIFLANEVESSYIARNDIEIYFVEKDPNDTVARKPFNQYPELVKELIDVYSEKERKQNKKVFRKKKRQKFFNKIKRGFMKLKKCRPEYIHDKVIHE